MNRICEFKKIVFFFFGFIFFSFIGLYVKHFESSTIDIGNNFVLTPTMCRMTGGFKYIELDGQ